MDLILKSDLVDKAERYWADQTRLLQRRILMPEPPGSKGEPSSWAATVFNDPGWPVGERAFRGAVTVLRQLLVANHAVGPKIDHADFQNIRSRPKEISDLNAKRGLPQRSEVLPIENDLRHHRDLAQLEVNLPIFAVLRRGGKPGRIGCGARKVPDPGFGKIGPGHQI